MQSITTKQFNENINSGGKQLIMFSGSFCAPCKMLTPVMDRLSENYSDVGFYKVDIEENPDLTNSLQIRGVPTLIYYKDGQITYTHVGATSASNISKHIEEFLK